MIFSVVTGRTTVSANSRTPYYCKKNPLPCRTDRILQPWATVIQVTALTQRSCSPLASLMRRRIFQVLPRSSCPCFPSSAHCSLVPDAIFYPARLNSHLPGYFSDLKAPKSGGPTQDYVAVADTDTGGLLVTRTLNKPQGLNALLP